MLNKNLIVRSLSGSVFVALIVTSIFISPLFFGILFLIITIIGTYELVRFSQNIEGLVVNKAITYISSILTYSVLFLVTSLHNPKWYLILLLLLPIILLIELYRKREFPLLNIAYAIFPSVYLALPLGLLNFILPIGNGWLLLAFFVTIWAGDTFAYIVGSLFGKHRLFERISPKKSWEGTIGSVLITLIVSYWYPDIFGILNHWQWSIFVVIALVSGSYGDLIESLFKRSVNVKDSGNIMPGHGGVLDRFDAVILASPIIFVFLQIIFN